MHPEWVDRFSAYLDDELDPGARRRVESHLARCPDCARVMAELRSIVAAAPEYQGTEPARDLWPVIRAAIDSTKGIEFPLRRPAARRFELRHLIAAGLVMAAVGAGVTWYVQPRPPVVAVAPEPPPATASNAGLSDPNYNAAIADLERILAANRSQLDTATVRIVDESLATIDRAIADAREAIQRDSSNAYLNERIAQKMRQKLNLLRVATRAIASQT